MPPGLKLPPFQTLKVVLLVENNPYGHFLLCHPLFYIMQALPPACYRRVLLSFPRFLLESRDYGRITTGESCTGESCFKNPGLYTALKSAVSHTKAKILHLIYMLFTGGEVRIARNCARGLGYGPRPWDVLKAEGTVFLYTDRPKPVNNVFLFSAFFCLKMNMANGLAKSLSTRSTSHFHS